MNLKSASKWFEDTKFPHPDYEFENLYYAGMQVSKHINPTIINLEKQTGRDNKMYYLSDTLNLESENEWSWKQLHNLRSVSHMASSEKKIDFRNYLPNSFFNKR